MTTCPYCGTPGQAGPNCGACGKQISSSNASSSSGGGDLDLMLKDVVSCVKCKFEFYEEDVADGSCPRCGRELEAADEPDDEDDGDGPSGEARGPARRGRARGPGGRKKVGKKGKKSKKKAPAPKQKIVLTEEFKSAVFNAFRRSDARAAQEMCFELAGENEDHAKQIYSYLLKIAKKKNWVGAGPAPASEGPIEVTPVQVEVTVEPGPGYGAPGMGQPGMGMPGMGMPGMGMPGMGQPGMGQPGMGQPGMGMPGQAGMGGQFDPLPMPAGILGGDPYAAPLPGQPLDALPMPAGILDSHMPGAQPLAGAPIPGLDANMPIMADAVTLRLPPGATGMPPAGSQASLLPAQPIPMPEPKAPAPAADPNVDPDSRGFLARVAIEGRSAQVSLLCRAGRFAAAKDLAQSTLARAPESSRAHAALGEALAGLGEDSQALAAYTNAVRGDPDDPVVVRGYAQQLDRLGRHTEAINAYHRIVGPGQGELKDAVALAAALRKAGNVQGAQRVIEEVVKRDPQSLAPLRQDAEAKMAAGNLDGAGDLLDRLVQRESPPYPLARALAESMVGRCGTSVRARLACARTFNALDRPFHAVRLLGPVAAAQPQNMEVRRTLGHAYHALGAGPQAEEHLLAVVKGGAGGAEEFRALGHVYLARGDSASGVKALVRARDAEPGNAETLRALARALAAQGDLDGAIRELRKLHQQSGDDAALEDELDRITERAFTQQVQELSARVLADEQDHAARLQLATALAQRGDLHEALQQLKQVDDARQAAAVAERIAEDYPHERAVVVLRVELLEATKDYAASIEALEAYLAEYPDGELRLKLFDQYAKGHRVADAVVALRAYLEEVNPYDLESAVALGQRLLDGEGSSYPGLALSLARARRKLGDVDAAVRDFRRYLESEPEDTEARVELARLLESAGRPAEAYAALEVLVSANAGSTAELEKLATLALAAGKIDQAVALLTRATDRHPEDLALQASLEAAQARQRKAQIAALVNASGEDRRLELAALYAEEGNKEQAMALLRDLNKLTDNPELGYLQFTAQHLARTGKTQRAEETLREVGRILSYPPGSEQHKDLLYRIATVYERAGASDRPSARRVFVELYAVDPAFRDVATRLENLSEDVRTGGHGVDERVLELVDVGAPLGTVFDALQTFDLTLDPRVLAGQAGAAFKRASEDE